MSKFISKITNFEGPCKPTWVNRNILEHRLFGYYTGFFRRTEKKWWWIFPVKIGPEFHGRLDVEDGQLIVIPIPEKQPYREFL